MSDPDILFLDEPTNHLDVEKIMVLEEWLNSQLYETAIVMVSHDRSFLDNCTNRTLFLRGAQVHDYNHSYTRAKQLLIADDKAAFAQREKELKELEALQKSAKKLRQIGVDNYSDKSLHRAAQLDKKVERLRSQLTLVYNETRRDVKLNTTTSQADYLLSIENVDIKAPNGEFLFQIDELKISPGERVVMLGANGTGKSQFAQHLVRAFASRDTSREQGIKITPSAKLGYVDQHLSNLDPKKDNPGTNTRSCFY